MADKRITELDKTQTITETNEILTSQNGVPKWLIFSKLVDAIKAAVGSGSDGGYYTPAVDAGGNLSWTPSKSGMPAVSGTNIKGAPGDPGETPERGVDYWTTADQNSVKSYCKDYIDTDLLGGAS